MFSYTFKPQFNLQIMRRVVVILFLLVQTISQAQDYKSIIKASFSDYLDAIVNLEFERSMDYMLPEFFEIVPREQLVGLMEQTFNNPDIHFKIKNPEILKVEDAQKIDGKYYALLTYANDMEIQLQAEADETSEEKGMRVSLTQAAFEQSFGKDNVVYNDSLDQYLIHSEKDVYSISENGVTDWKFLVLGEKQKAILERLLPAQLIED